MAHSNVGPIQSSDRLIDSSDGTASSTNTILGPSVRGSFSLSIALANIADGDVLTDFPIGAALGGSGKITGVYAYPTTVASTGGKASTLNLEIGTTNVTGGVLALTTTTMGTLGLVQTGTAITANNTFTATGTLSIEASSTTTFSQGVAQIVIIYELDNADNNFATIISTLG